MAPASAVSDKTMVLCQTELGQSYIKTLADTAKQFLKNEVSETKTQVKQCMSE